MRDFRRACWALALVLAPVSPVRALPAPRPLRARAASSAAGSAARFAPPARAASPAAPLLAAARPRMAPALASPAALPRPAASRAALSRDAAVLSAKSSPAGRPAPASARVSGRGIVRRAAAAASARFAEFLSLFGARAAAFPDDALPFSTEDWTEEQARGFAGAFLELFRPEIEAAGFEPMLVLDWENVIGDTAMKVKYDGMLYHGLMMSRVDILRFRDKDVLAVALLHELGHFLGEGPRYKGQRLAYEGEADYFSMGRGLSRASEAGLLDYDHSGARKTPEYREALAHPALRGRPRAERERLARSFSAALRIIRSTQGPGEKPVSFSARDESVVEATDKNYPSPQARLDTLAAGILGLPRPRSWAHPSDYPRASE